MINKKLEQPYLAPQVEVVELKSRNVLCQSTIFNMEEDKEIDGDSNPYWK